MEPDLMLLAFRRRLLCRRTRNTSPRRRPARSPRLECPEDRLAPATFAVNTTLDVLGHTDGQLSLRQAILDANSAAQTGTPARITFNFAADDPNHFYYRD